MQITIEEYNPAWPKEFQGIKQKLDSILGSFQPKVEHIGSTSVPGLAAKPIIDIAVGIQSMELLDEVIQPMRDNHFIYYELFNESMPNRRLFVGLKNPMNINQFQSIYTKNDHIPHDAINTLRHSHIHVWEYNSTEWIRHLAFRDYLITHPIAFNEYADLKRQLSLQSWKDGMEYNAAKNDFIKELESKAVSWDLENGK